MNFLIKSVLSGIIFAFILGSFSLSAQSEQLKIEELVSKKKLYNQENKTSVVYKIQLFNGSETEAAEVKEEFDEEFPEFKAVLKYKSPEWKTQVGEFKTRLLADRILITFLKKFPSAIVVEDRI